MGAIMVTYDERMLGLQDRVLHIEDGKIREDFNLQKENHPTPSQAKGGSQEEMKLI
jgi:ABC-type lipoprotein export system ATPase subunit